MNINLPIWYHVSDQTNIDQGEDHGLRIFRFRNFRFAIKCFHQIRNLGVDRSKESTSKKSHSEIPSKWDFSVRKGFVRDFPYENEKSP